MLALPILSAIILFLSYFSLFLLSYVITLSSHSTRLLPPSDTFLLNIHVLYVTCTQLILDLYLDVKRACILFEHIAQQYSDTDGTAPRELPETAFTKKILYLAENSVHLEAGGKEDIFLALLVGMLSPSRSTSPLHATSLKCTPCGGPSSFISIENCPHSICLNCIHIKSGDVMCPVCLQPSRRVLPMPIADRIYIESMFHNNQSQLPRSLSTVPTPDELLPSHFILSVYKHKRSGKTIDCTTDVEGYSDDSSRSLKRVKGVHDGSSAPLSSMPTASFRPSPFGSVIQFHEVDSFPVANVSNFSNDTLSSSSVQSRSSHHREGSLGDSVDLSVYQASHGVSTTIISSHHTYQQPNHSISLIQRSSASSTMVSSPVPLNQSASSGSSPSPTPAVVPLNSFVPIPSAFCHRCKSRDTLLFHPERPCGHTLCKGCNDFLLSSSSSHTPMMDVQCLVCSKVNKGTVSSSTLSTSSSRSCSQHEQRVSCHKCKRHRAHDTMLFCTTKKEGQRPCRKKFCFKCLSNFEEYANSAHLSPEEVMEWSCPACSGVCGCKSCLRMASGGHKS